MSNPVDKYQGEEAVQVRFGKQTFRAFKNPVFRLYYAAMVGQWAPLNMQMLARALLLKRLTESPLIVGGMALANAIPVLTLSLFGGVIAERVQKKYVLMAGQAASAVISLGVALTLSLGFLSAERAGSWWLLIVASFLQGIVQALMMPSRQAIISEIVSGEELMNAVSLSTLGMNALRIIAPALAGFLIDTLDFEAVYYTMTGLYLVSVIFVVMMPLTGTITLRGRGALNDVKEGFTYLRKEISLILVLLFTLFTVILSMPYTFMLPFFTDDILNVGASGLGVLMGVSGVGAIAGSLVLASLPNRKRGLMLLAGGLISGLALVVFAFSTSWYLSLGIIVFVGLGQTMRMTLGNTLLQYYVDDEYRGRVMSLYMMEFGLMSLGTFASGWLGEAFGVQWAIGGLAIVLVIISVLALFFVPRLRKLE